MLNRTIADLADATVRTRFFGGRGVDVLAAEMPILPVDAPGLPLPGPNFISYAQVIGDQPPAAVVVGKRRRQVTTRPNGPFLHALVRTVLYQLGQVVDIQGKSTVFHPGVLMFGDPKGDFFGPQPCRLMVIGKCLGPQEVAQGRPFIGPGSKPLWDAWHEALLPPTSPDFKVYVTNLVPYVPPGHLSRLSKDIIADGRHLLYQAIAVCRPSAILILGADALKALYGSKAKITDFRGRVASFEVDCRPSADTPEDLHVAKVIATDHPAAIAREPDNYPILLNGLKLLARELGFRPPEAAVAIDHQAVYTIPELRAAVHESVKASSCGGYIAFDCEWEGRHPTDPGAYVYTVQWSHAPGHARVVYLRRCGGEPNAALPLEEAVPLLRLLLERVNDRASRLVGHFAKADLPWLYSIGVDLYPYFVGPDDDAELRGWQKTYYEGGFDIYVAAHAVDESQERGLEVLATTYAGLHRYDLELSQFIADYCHSHKISRKRLKGYGCVPERIMTSYACYDADGAGRLYLRYNGDPRSRSAGLLDYDRFGQSCRQGFGNRMRAWGAWAEMERQGLLIDRPRQKELREELARKKEELLLELRQLANWPDLNLAKRRHKVELLFGETWIAWPRQAPAGALYLNLTPYKCTKTSYRGALWDEAVMQYSADSSLPKPMPAADQETIIHRARENKIVEIIRDIDFIATAMKILFRPPKEVDFEDETERDEEDLEILVDLDDAEFHDAGLLSLICGDGRIRSVFGLVETGRASSSRPNLQNISSGRDDQFNRILGWGDYAPEGNTAARDKKFVSRSIFKAPDGWFLIGADLKGAEILAAAGFSGDATLLEHAQRACLPEDDPNWLDLHSDLANRAFGLNLPLKEVKKKHKPLRVASKRARFGHYYGASAETVLRQALEEDANVTLAQVEAILTEHDKTYPVLATFFASCRARVQGFGWLANCFGGRRRFRKTTDRERAAGQGREAQNWSCQALVADAMNMALGNLWYEMRRRRMRARIVLSVHDSVLVEAPPEEVALLVDVLLPLCFTERVTVTPTDLNGTPNGRPPFHFGIDIEVARNWGEDVDESEWRSRGKEVLAS